MQREQQWFQHAKWGVFMHFLADAPGTRNISAITAEAWNRQVDGFDVEGLARQLKSVGADYFCLSIGQNSGHYCAPNRTYDDLTGIAPSKCSRRDLIADLSDALAQWNIPLMVYLPSGAPEFDFTAVERLQWKRDGGRLAEFQRNWEGVIREWSLRWKDKVKGWWIDGCYYADDMYRFDDAPNFHSFSQALKAGNPHSLVAFNAGTGQPFKRVSDWEDYTAGETAGSLPVFFDWNPGPPEGLIYHILSFLGGLWATGAPRFTDDLVVSFTRYINAHGGRITWDVPFYPTGLIRPEFVRQLKILGESLSSSVTH